MNTNETKTKNLYLNGILKDSATIIFVLFRKPMSVAESFSFPQMDFIHSCKIRVY